MGTRGDDVSERRQAGRVESRSRFAEKNRALPVVPRARLHADEEAVCQIPGNRRFPASGERALRRLRRRTRRGRACRPLTCGERLNQALAAVLEVVRDVLDRAWSLHCRRRRIFKGSAASGSGARNASAVAFDARTTHESRHGTCDERASDVPGSADEAGDVCASPMRGD